MWQFFSTRCIRLRKICVLNKKGGVGKTTVTINIAAGLARAGKKVLLIDLDSQSNLETCLPIKEEKKDMYHILMENADPKECIHRIAINLDLIKSNEKLTKAELVMVGESAREYILSRRLNVIRGYDYIILDCPPSLSLLNQNALLFAEEVIVPVSTDPLGIDALKKTTRAIYELSESFGHDIEIKTIVPTLYDKRNKISRDSLQIIQSEYYELATTPIRVNIKLKECAKAKRSIFAYAKSSPGAKDFQEVVNHVLRQEENASPSDYVDIKEGKAMKVKA